MKYPEHTNSQPLSLKEARKVIHAVKTGQAITNSASEATIERILAKAAPLSDHGKTKAKIHKK